eukprot:TRINITY_DN6125_c0_g1_i2.p1 TRINITY_DN6125_c0_g1~~TRINITY_DN6125_c0_g1_i2.p1  ORF type:complete len:684 (-),score=130.82 TRINITY_DN6125_c0_g1_i2:140-2191(-)
MSQISSSGTPGTLSPPRSPSPPPSTVSASASSSSSGSSVPSTSYNKFEYVDWKDLPELRVAPTKRNIHITKVQGPRSLAGGKKDFFATRNGEVVFKGRTVSTYPRFRGTARQGDPIADKFSALIYDNRSIIALADGCNWGVRPLEAADKSITGFLSYMSANHLKIKTTREAGMHLYNALLKAHDQIIKGKKDLFMESGTTTFIGSISFELKDRTPRWGVVTISVGESKLFLYSEKTKQITEVTSGNRRDISDWRDPGGRLGPYIDKGQPDLRNLRYYFVECEDRDILLHLTDGVHDNFHPYYLGKSVKDLNLSQDTWEKAVVDHASSKTVDSFICQNMTDLLNQAPATPVAQVNSLIRYSLESTKKVRNHLTNNPKAKPPPANSADFPGKLDHATAVAFRLGRIDTEPVVSDREIFEWRVFCTPDQASSVLDPLLLKLAHRNTTLVDKLQRSAEEPFSEYYINIGSADAFISVSQDLNAQFHITPKESGNVKFWISGESFPLSSSLNKKSLLRNIKSSVVNNLVVLRRVNALTPKIERVNPTKDTIQVRGKRKQVSFGDFGNALRVLSGNLIVGQADIEIVGEGNNVLGNYKTIYLRSSKGDFLTEFVKTNIKVEPTWNLISIPELLQKLVNDTPANSVTSSPGGSTIANQSSNNLSTVTSSQSMPAVTSSSDAIVKSQSGGS